MTKRVVVLGLIVVCICTLALDWHCSRRLRRSSRFRLLRGCPICFADWGIVVAALVIATASKGRSSLALLPLEHRKCATCHEAQRH